eukprot:scaffold4390_cov264-Pinguiococcus_pyrenoidosus.AAC.16
MLARKNACGAWSGTSCTATGWSEAANARRRRGCRRSRSSWPPAGGRKQVRQSNEDSPLPVRPGKLTVCRASCSAPGRGRQRPSGPPR